MECVARKYKKNVISHGSACLRIIAVRGVRKFAHEACKYWLKWEEKQIFAWWHLSSLNVENACKKRRIPADNFPSKLFLFVFLSFFLCSSGVEITRKWKRRKMLKSWTKSINIISFPIFQSIDSTCLCCSFIAERERVRSLMVTTWVANWQKSLVFWLFLLHSASLSNALDIFNWFFLPVIFSFASIYFHFPHRLSQLPPLWW